MSTGNREPLTEREYVYAEDEAQALQYHRARQSVGTVELARGMAALQDVAYEVTVTVRRLP